MSVKRDNLQLKVRIYSRNYYHNLQTILNISFRVNNDNNITVLLHCIYIAITIIV